MTIFDIMPTWLAYILTGMTVLVPLAISIGIIVLIVISVKVLIKHAREK